MKKILLSCVLSLACSHTVLASDKPELEVKKQKDQTVVILDLTARRLVHPQKSPPSPFHYGHARTRALEAKPSTFAKHFRGAVGTPGGINPLFPLALKEASKNPTSHCPQLLPHMHDLAVYIQKHGGPYKEQALAQLQSAMNEKRTSAIAFVTALLHGMKPHTVSGEAIDLVAHTIIDEDFEHAMRAVPEEGAVGLYHNHKKRRPDNYRSQRLLRFNYLSYPEWEHTLKKFAPRLGVSIYFGGKFGFTTASELFFHQTGIIGVPDKAYLAHGIFMDPFSAIMHDSGHLEVMEFVRFALKQVAIGLCDHHLALGGTVSGFKKAQATQRLAFEQNRFLGMMNLLNQEAFRRWGGD